MSRNLVSLPKWEIRIARLADCHVILRLHKTYASMMKNLWEDDKKNMEEFHDHKAIITMIKKGQMFVAWKETHDGRVVIGGCIGCKQIPSDHDDTLLMEIGYLCVAPEFRKQGVSAQLIDYCQVHALNFKGTNWKNIILQCELLLPKYLKQNPHPFQEMLSKYYQSWGMKEIKRVPFEIAHPELVARRKLRIECVSVLFQKQLRAERFKSRL